jgi:Ala-tRNA(Pro) deacylase
MNGQPELYRLLKELDIEFNYYEHPPAPTIEIAMQYWKDIDAMHCKNLFFRNHKGNRHYLVIIDHKKNLDIHTLEKILKQGKLTFASEQRMMKYLGLRPGSVSPFGLMNDKNHEVHLFIDESLKDGKTISFHPNENTASLVIDYYNFTKFITYCGNIFEYIDCTNQATF